MSAASDGAIGVIFDMDGVLVDSTEAHFVAWRRLGEKIGSPCPRELFESTFGMHNLQIIPLWLGSALDEGRIAELSAEKEAMYREVAVEMLTPLDGVTELIDALAESGFRLAVGSSGPLANVSLVLETLGVAARFSALSTGDEVIHGKPHPDVFLKAAGKLSLPPARCVVVEDAPQGVAAGLAAGCRVVAVTSTRPAGELRDAHLVLGSLAELDPERFRRLVAASDNVSGGKAKRDSIGGPAAP